MPDARTPPTRRPNFLLFITDQQRADHLGAYGNPVVRTPHLDRLAAGGWQADRCHVASPICMPNRGSLMTGRMPSVHGARHNGIPLPLDARTFVERLREEGWRTALVGKSHLQNITGFPAQYPRADAPPTRGEARRQPAGRYDQEREPSWDGDPAFELDLPFYGFESVDLVINHGDTAGGHYRRWLQREHPGVAAVVGPEHAIPTPEFELSRCRQAWRTRVPEELSTTSFVAMRTRERLSRFAAGGQPFFVQCSFPDPHHPFTPPGRFWDMYRPEDMTLPPSFHMARSGPMPHLDWMHAERDQGKAVKHSPAMFAANEREVREALALNYGSIAHIDEAIGSVLRHLESLGLEQDTVVIFTSDHGDYFGDHQLLWKGPLHYQGLTRVPLIWHDPDAALAGRSSQLCSTIDLAPTILARAGCTPYNGIQGRSLLDRQAPPRQALLIEEEGQRVMFGFPGRTRMRTLQTERHRLSIYAGAEWGELYDLHDDPHESRNLWDDAGHATLRHELLHQLSRLMIEAADESPSPTALA
ncbi:sulfatase-like hydrolase/transferase [Ramlibacter sp. AW1]|uniref:Sulfatase-like hydrolase/transferase n=1 Tax=Ramlibacter aurantiacus TaxID=2801330 RepID=A0A936ZLA0_9BURK|nr:sulfatase-like hydrolase/transferase [Ramlibacter aurantiacus]MBL0422967.1 sulfatase-like hydrolase/transferase [Ramlibacter aurantiacus]